VKLWAKRKTLINAKMPTDGLSSYGVILMALFYLIKTDQAPYVIGDMQEYRLSKNLLG
jgi:DNA polymerase sigma